MFFVSTVPTPAVRLPALYCLVLPKPKCALCYGAEYQDVCVYDAEKE
jgi:hypothetical protein